MDAFALLESLNPDTVAPVYLLHGQERFLIDQVVAKLKELVLAGPMASLNFIRLDAANLTGAEISANVREMPMMARKRLVLVENGHKLNTNDFEVLDKLFTEPEPQTCLVIEADRFDLQRGPLARANRRKQVHKAEPLKERSANAFVRLRANARKVRINAEALAALSAAVGPNCSALDDAIERLGLFVGPGREIRENDVHEVVTNIRENTVFELVDAMGNRQPSKAIKIVENLLSKQEDPLKINAMLARHFRQLLNARIHLHLRTSREELASLLSVPDFAVDKLLAQTKRFKGAELERALSRVYRADLELKSSRRPKELVVVQSVLDLCLSQRSS